MRNEEQHASVKRDGKGKLKGWQASGKLVTGGENKVTLSADFDEPGEYTVQFFVIPPVHDAAPALSGVFDCLATIQWFVEGGQVNRQISVGDGASITGVGQGIKVTISDQSRLVLGDEYTVFCQVAPGSRASTGQPATLRGFYAAFLCHHGSFLNIDIPVGAGVQSVQTSIVSASTDPASLGTYKMTVGQFDPAGQLMKGYEPTIQSGFVPIAPNATSLDIQNYDTTFDVWVQVVWGIDG